MLESSGVCVMADGQYNAQTRIQVLLEYLHEREMDLEDLAEMKRVKLEQCVQLGQYINLHIIINLWLQFIITFRFFLGQFQNDAQQVISWIRNGEAMLAASFSVPGGLADAERLRREHDQFQVAVERTHASAVQVKYRADALVSANHYDPQTIR